MGGSGDANSGFCAMLLAMASHHLRQPLHVIDSARDVLVPIHHGGSAQGTAGCSGRGCYQATDRQSRQPPASRVGGRRRTRDRRKACSRWRAIRRHDVILSSGSAIDEVASTVAERSRSRRRLAPLCAAVEGLHSRGDGRHHGSTAFCCGQGEVAA